MNKALLCLLCVCMCVIGDTRALSIASVQEAGADEPFLRKTSLTRGKRQVEQIDGVSYVLSGDALLIIKSEEPILRGEVHLDSEDAWILFEGVRPSEVESDWLKHISINGDPAKLDKNVRLAPAVNGTAVLPHGPDYQPLTTYRKARFEGESRSYSLHIYYKAKQLGDDNDKIASFVLKKGYMATLAENQDGTGASKVFIARDQDMKLSSLPSELRDKVSFVRVFLWRWTGKKGYGGKAKTADLLAAQWRYDWGASGSSTLDQEYVLMKHNPGWPSFKQINAKQNVTHLLGFNEPMQKKQANMTVDQVIKLWPKMQQSGLRLGSPCTTDGTVDWLYDFMEKADKLGYRVDFIAVHYYKGGWTDEALIAWLREIHRRTGRPLWVTEFNNGAHWVKGHNPSLQDNAKAIEGYSKAMDACDFIERYAVFNLKDNRSIIRDGKLTPAGKRYSDNPSVEAYTDKR